MQLGQFDIMFIRFNTQSHFSHAQEALRVQRERPPRTRSAHPAPLLREYANFELQLGKQIEAAS
jgi:hypothetical protein